MVEGSRESAAVRVGGGENGRRPRGEGGDLERRRRLERKHLGGRFGPDADGGGERTRAYSSSPERSKGTHLWIAPLFETGARVRD